MKSNPSGISMADSVRRTDQRLRLLVCSTKQDVYVLHLARQLHGKLGVIA